MKWLVLMSVVAAGGARSAERGRQLDARLVTSAGAPTTLSAHRGKPTLLFYEDPDAVHVNQRWKDELARLSAKHGLATKVGVVAVCDLRPLNWEPALFFALLAVRGEEQKAKITVLLDLTGELARAPWNLSAQRASVVLLSAEGEVLFEAIGPMSEGTFAALVSALTTLLTPAVAEATHG